MGEVVDLDQAENKLYLKDGELSYDTLVVATGVTHHYFGNDNWAPVAPGLKTIEEALEIRRRIFSAFEKAEKEPDLEKRKALLTFIVIGAGPTGVELAGALAEMAHHGLKDCFHNIDPSEATVLLLQGADRILPTFPEDLSKKATEELEGLGVTVRTNARAMNIDPNGVTIKCKVDNHVEYIGATTILWAAGVKASPMAQVIANRTGAPLDNSGRVLIEPNLTVPNHPNIFVIGDVANFSHQGSEPLPGLAPVAQQQGVYVAKLIQQRLKARILAPFHYADNGTLAMIGRNQAVANLTFGKFSGFTAWMMWVFVHILFLIEFDNQLLVMIQWGWSYFTRQGGARLITNRTSPEETSVEQESAVQV
jgi:NADH dehydrogenase